MNSVDGIYETVRELKKRASYFILASVVEPEQIRNWKRKKMPLEEAEAFRCDYYSLESEYSTEGESFVYFGVPGSAMMLIDGKAYFGIDAFHRIVDVPEGSHQIRLEATHRGLFGNKTFSSIPFNAVLFKKNILYEKIYYKLITLLDFILISRDETKLNTLLEMYESFPLLNVSALAYIVHGDLFSDDFTFSDAALKILKLKERNESILEDVKSANKLSEEIDILLRDCRLSVECTIMPLGHAHTDLAWLWPVAETTRKSLRTFASVLHLLEKFDFLFVQSMAWHYKLVEDAGSDYAIDIFDRIRKMVSQGKWVPIGGMMVEPDCNLTSGESIVRQALYGQLYFQEKFGTKSSIAWLPDTFGFSPQLPQILRLSGFDLFLTTKLSWNDTNRFPHDMFTWTGIDGTAIAAHSHMRTYNSDLSPVDLAESLELHPETKITGIMPVIFGKGDGGGGPTGEMLEQLDVIRKTKSAVTTGNTLYAWLESIKHNMEKLPRFNGELYLEYHRGTYTTHADIKKLNRKTESLLFLAEAHAVAASVHSRSTPSRFRAEWEVLLKNQFHDILPGSSVRQVYIDSVSELSELDEKLNRLIADNTGEAENFSIFCPYSWPTSYLMELGDKFSDGDILVSESGTWYPVFTACHRKFVELKFEEGMGFYGYTKKKGSQTRPAVIHRKDFVAGNWHVRIEKNRICSLSFSDREMPPPDFRLFQDFPSAFDAWELDRKKIESGRSLDPHDIRISAPENGCVAIRQRYDLFPGSMTVEYLFFSDGLCRMFFNVDWRGNNRLLRMYFKTGGNRCHGEVAYGHVVRKSEGAVFEFPAQRFICVETAAGLFALFNDGKYGNSFEDGMLGTSLLRSPVYPDIHSDRGNNLFSFAFGFIGDLQQCHQEGFKFNVPPSVCSHTGRSKFRLEGAMLGALKAAEHDNAIIARLYNPSEKTMKFRLTVPFELSDCRMCDLLENNREGTSLEIAGTEIKGSIHQFGIITLKLTPK